MTAEFDFDPRLAANIRFQDWELSTVFLRDDRRFPWLILVPRRGNVREIHDLAPADQIILMNETTRASKTILRAFQPDKINIGAIGHVVAQLHIHVLGRREDDALWPDPVWGPGERAPHKPEPYSEAGKASVIDELEKALARG